MNKSRYVHFRASSNRIRDINVSNFYLQNVSQGYGIKILQRGLHSMTNIEIYKFAPCVFARALTRFGDINVSIFYIQKLGQCQGLQFFPMTSMANVKICKGHFLHFCFH